MVGDGRQISNSWPDRLYLGFAYSQHSTGTWPNQPAIGLVSPGHCRRIRPGRPHYRLADHTLREYTHRDLEHHWLLPALTTPALAVNAVTLFAALAVYGALAGANDVSMNSQAVAVEMAMNTPTMSRFHAMFSIGGMIGASLGGLIAAHGVNPVIHFFIACGILLILSVCTAPFLLDAQDHAPAHSDKPSLRRLPAVLLVLTALGFCMFLSEGAMADWTGVYLKQVMVAGIGMAAAGYAVFSAGMAIFRLLGDAVTKRLGPVNTVRAGAMLAAFGLALALTTHSPDWALLGFGLTGAGFSVIVPLVFAAGGRMTSLPRGAGIAMVSGSGYIGFLFGPPLIGFAAQWLSLKGALFLVVALSLLAAGLAGAVARPAYTES